MIKLILTYITLFATLLLQAGCKREAFAEPSPVTAEKDLYVSSELLVSAPQSMLQALATSNGYDTYATRIKYGVSVYRMVYTTSYRGRDIKASGLVCVPQNMTTPAPLISAQHGTIFTQNEAPSTFASLSGFELLAAGGYVVLVPDYIGFGASKDIFHPYYDQKHSALAVVDMIKAGKSFCEQQEVALNDKLFLAGYSEGGFVTLAAQKEIETNPAHGLQVTASAAGAGGYDLTSMLSSVASGQPYAYPAYLAYVLQAYNHTNGWNRPLHEFFREPYASKLPGLFNGAHSGGTINGQLANDPKQLFAPAFYQALQTSDQERALKIALQANSFLNWAPQSPTRLYHGTADNIVPYDNSRLTFERFKALGATQTELIPIKDGTHGSALVPMLESMLPWMQTF